MLSRNPWAIAGGDAMFGLLRKLLGQQPPSEDGSDREGDRLETPTGTAARSSTGAAMDGRDAEAASDADDWPVPLDQIFDILSNHRRRAVLQILTETARIERGDLAEQIAARENDTPVHLFSSEEHQRVEVKLYQVHLPKLADADAITYDESRGIIEPGPAFRSFANHLPDDPEAAATGTEDRR